MPTVRLAALATLLAPLAAGAAAPGDPIRAVRLIGELTIDGRLEEPDWDRAPVHDGFFQVFPREGEPPSEATEVRVLYDDRALYVGVRCRDSHPEAISRPLGRRDAAPYSDAVVVLVDSMRDRRTAYQFKLTAAGVQEDALRLGDDDPDTAWDAVWEGAASATPDGWSAELRIPLAALRFSPAPAQTWGFAVKRILARTREELASAPLSRFERGLVGRLADLTGLEGLAPVQELSITPYLASRLSLRPRFSDPAVPRPRLVDPSGDVGVDVSTSLGRGLALHGTVNPDFGQVEADQVVQNLTTFELLFPEKRPFFTQGMDLFQGVSPRGQRSPQQLFYSRRVGLDAPILGAAKVTGRASDEVQVGLLEAFVTGAAAPAGSTEADPVRAYRFSPAQPFHFAPAGSLPELAPASRNVAVATARWQPLPTGAFGLTGTSVEPGGPACTADEAALPDGSRPLRCGARTGEAAALDLDLRTPDGRWYLRGQATGSRHGGGAPVLTLADGTALRRGDLGGGGFVSLGKQGGEPWRFDLSWEYESPRLDLNAAGYQKTQNEQKGRAVLRWVRPGGGGPFHEYLAFLGAETRWTTDGRGLERGNVLYLVAQVQLRSFHTIGTNLSLESDFDDVRELAGTGVSLRRPGLAGAELWVASDKGLPAWIELDLYATRNRSLGPLPATASGGAQLTLAVRPHPAAETKLDLVVDDSRFAARWVEDLPSGDHLLAALHAPSLSVTLRQQLVLTPRLSLQGYAQLFAAAARYGPTYTAPATAGGRIGPSDLSPGGAPSASPDHREAKLALNAVLRWEYRLGSTLFLVYTRAQAEPPWAGAAPPPLALRPLGLARGPTTDTALVKWTWRFGG